jgi:hypothetical protein
MFCLFLGILLWDLYYKGILSLRLIVCLFMALNIVMAGFFTIVEYCSKKLKEPKNDKSSNNSYIIDNPYNKK